MRQQRTKAYLKTLSRAVKQAERRVQSAKDDLDTHRRFWRRQVDEYWKEQRVLRAIRKAKA